MMRGEISQFVAFIVSIVFFFFFCVGFFFFNSRLGHNTLNPLYPPKHLSSRVVLSD